MNHPYIVVRCKTVSCDVRRPAMKKVSTEATKQSGNISRQKTDDWTRRQIGA